MERGVAVHHLALQPEAWCAKYQPGPIGKDRRHKEFKEAAEAFDGVLLPEKEYGDVQDIRASLLAHPFVRKVINDRSALREFAMTWEWAGGLPMKGRIDLLSRGVVVDVKTCNRADADFAAKSVVNYQYHAQAAIYLEGLKAAMDQDFQYVLVFVESEPPYAVAVYSLDEKWLAMGARLAQAWRHAVRNAVDSGLWPGYGTEVEPLVIPKWLEKREESIYGVE